MNQLGSPSLKRRKRRRQLFAALSVVVGLTLAWGVSEAALRIYAAGRGWTPNCYVTGLVFFVPHRQAGHTLRANLRLKSSTYDITTNSHGLRGPEIVREKPAGTRRIAVLGGSSVFGYLVADGKDSCRVLQSLLQDSAQGARRKIEVLNAGVPGYNVTQCRLRYETEIAPLSPDVVLLYLGWNDSKFLISSAAEGLDRTPPGPPWIQRTLSHSMLYGVLRYRLFPAPTPRFTPPAGASTDVTEPGAKVFRTELRRLINSIRQSGATPVVSTQLMAAQDDCLGLDGYLGQSAEQVEANRRIGMWITQTLRDLSAECQVAMIDVSAQLTCDRTLLGDAIHLTEHGHRQVAMVWAEGLRPLLAQAPDETQVGRP